MADSNDSTAQLVRECEVYSRYLVGRQPSDFVREKYVSFHRSAAACFPDAGDTLDRLLLACSRVSPALAALADSYSSRFRKASSLRRKIVLTLAILECCPRQSRWIDSVDRGPLVVVYLRILSCTARYALALLLSMVVFGPVHLLSRRSGSHEERVPG